MATTLVGAGKAQPQRRDTLRVAHVATRAQSRRAALVRAVVATGAVTLLIACGSIWNQSSLEALETGATSASARATLHLTAAYTIFSPLCEAYDALTLLTLPQHAALLGWLLATYAAMRVLRRRTWRDSIDARDASHGAGRELTLLGVLLLGFVVAYLAGAIVPRPMAAIALDDRDELAVDLHSHTSASHDGRRGFDPEANRRWHAAAGFAAAYITDHRSYEGAITGARGNPQTAGEGTVLLPGIESMAPHSHVVLLGARSAMGLDENGHLDASRLANTPGVVVILTAPASLARMPDTLPLNGVEGSDASPRGLMFTRQRAPAIARFASSRGLIEVAGSNNHGWGRTAAAWTVLRIPGWRALSPDSLDRAIRSTLLHRAARVRVVRRGSLSPARSAVVLIETPALLAWSIVTRLSTAERGAWLIWAWSAAMLALFLTARRDTVGRRGEVLLFKAPPPNAGVASARIRRRAGRRGEG